MSLRHALCVLALGGCARLQPVAPAPARPSAAAAPALVQPKATETAGRRRNANAAELALVQRLMRDAERIRALRFLAPIRVSIEDRVAMRAYVEREIDEAALARARRRYLALGAIDPALDLRALFVDLMGHELVGYYDPKEKRLAVREDIARALERPGGARDLRGLTSRATVLHELVHALQDQHFQIGRLIEEERSTDADNALGALIEGDATLAMLGYTAELGGISLASVVADPAQVTELLARAPDQLSGALRSAPALLREPLLFRYREGARFCAELAKRAGYAAVDRAFAALPASSSAIHDVRHYDRSHELLLADPEIPALAAQGYTFLDRDTLGALELGILLGASPAEVEQIFASWRSDRYLVLERGGRYASVWWLRVDSAAMASKLVQAAKSLGDPVRQAYGHDRFAMLTYGLDDEAARVARLWFRDASGSLAPRTDARLASPEDQH